MASPLHAALCALLATAFYTSLGYALGRHLLPRGIALGAAPVVGWAVFSAASLPILTLTGFSVAAVTGVAALALVIAGCSMLAGSAPDTSPAPAMPAYSLVAAAVLALVPAVAILPKISSEGAHLADPIFDHSKIAIVDAMVRQGLPPVNPVFGESGAAGHLAYYYLWHFSAAELALPLRLGGWNADAGLTWFTAFASLTLMMGMAVWLSKRSAAAILVVMLAAGASLRETCSLLFGNYSLEPFLTTPTGFAGWLFQTAWVPQHLMSASCVTAAMLLAVQFMRRPSAVRLITLALIVAAGFESSTFVGGVTFALAVLASAPFLVLRIEPARRVRVMAGLALAGLLALVLIGPFLHDQFAAVVLRGGGNPLAVRPFDVLGAMVPAGLRRALDLPAYWLILLPIEFPAIFIAGTIALGAMLRGMPEGEERSSAAVLAALAGAGLCASWLLASTLGDNNDLGLRAVLAAVTALIAAAAAGMMRRSCRAAIVATAVGGLLLSLPDTAAMIYSNVAGRPAADSRAFAQSPELWSVVRRYAPPGARVANNPLYLQDLTPWPVNVSWALLADRNSCFAGREMALAFAPLPAGRREAINAQFIRVFAGHGTAGDVGDMAEKFSCDVVLVVPQDGAWNSDPFATSPDYRLAESRDGQWRIYLKAPANPAAH